MTEWEYQRMGSLTLGEGPNRIVSPVVNGLGKRGWELVGFDYNGAAWFKRPLSSEEPFPVSADEGAA